MIQKEPHHQNDAAFLFCAQESIEEEIANALYDTKCYTGNEHEDDNIFCGVYSACNEPYAVMEIPTDENIERGIERYCNEVVECEQFEWHLVVAGKEWSEEA